MLILGVPHSVPTKLALFDLDWTLIRPAKGAIFFQGVPYVWLPNRLPTLLRIAQAGHSIGIITNQNAGGSDVHERLTSVMMTIDTYLSSTNTSPVFLFAAFKICKIIEPRRRMKNSAMVILLILYYSLPSLAASDGNHIFTVVKGLTLWEMLPEQVERGLTWIGSLQNEWVFHSFLLMKCSLIRFLQRSFIEKIP